MDIEIVDKGQAWRRRGHPRREVPEDVKALADATYQTGNVGRVARTPDNDDQVAELLRVMRSYAKSRGCLLRVQRDKREVRFEMADK